MLKGIEDAKNKGFKGEQLQVMCHALPVSCPTLAGLGEVPASLDTGSSGQL